MTAAGGVVVTPGIATGGPRLHTRVALPRMGDGFDPRALTVVRVGTSGARTSMGTGEGERSGTWSAGEGDGGLTETNPYLMCLYYLSPQDNVPLRVTSLTITGGHV